MKFTVHFFSMILLLVLISCFNKQSTNDLQGDSFQKSSLDCEANLNIYWCSKNTKQNSPFNEVCTGRYVMDDIGFYSIFLKSVSQKECLVDRGPWAEVEHEGCERAYERTMSSSFSSSKTTKVIVCRPGDKPPYLVNGVSSGGFPFQAQE